MSKTLGQIIHNLRKNLNLTQDQFGAKYDVSGPAIFKFENDYVRPSLALWMRIAEDCNMAERESVLHWARAKLPDQYRHLLDVDETASLDNERYQLKSDVPQYARIKNPDKLRKSILEDKELPEGLHTLISDDDFWIVFKPTGAEIYGVMQKFGMFRGADKDLFAEALRSLRSFIGQERI